MKNTWIYASGPVGVALLLLGNSTLGSAPGTDATREEVRSYLAALDPSWAGVVLELLGFVALLLFFAALSRRAADGTVRACVLAGGVAGVSLKLATSLPQIAVWTRAEEVDPALAAVVFDLGTIGFSVGGALFALVPGALAFAGVLPRWLGAAGAITALALLAQIPLFLEEFALGFLLLMLWIIATGITLVRATARNRAPHVRGGTAQPRPA